MKLKKKKISIAMLASKLEINGISTVIWNYCTHMDLLRFDITVLAGRPINEYYINEFTKLGIRVIELPERKGNSINYLRELNKIMKNEKFDIVHVHGNQASIALELLVAYMNGIKVRIAHSHNTTCKSMRVHKLLKPLFNLIYTDGFACGEAAGKWLFGNGDFTVIPNGFDTNKFEFNSSYRSEIRTKLGIENRYVIGHIGRINEQKNQTYLLKIFEKVAADNENAVLLMVGTGPMQPEIEKLVDDHPYKDRIIMFGETNSPEKLYSAMDVFVFPSLYEGLPVTLLEAQINGLRCVASAAVTREVMLYDNSIHFIKLSDDVSYWADAIKNQLPDLDRDAIYKEHEDSIIRYNIADNVNLVNNIYVDLIRRRYANNRRITT